MYCSCTCYNIGWCYLYIICIQASSMLCCCRTVGCICKHVNKDSKVIHNAFKWTLAFVHQSLHAHPNCYSNVCKSPLLKSTLTCAAVWVISGTTTEIVQHQHWHVQLCELYIRYRQRWRGRLYGDVGRSRHTDVFLSFTFGGVSNLQPVFLISILSSIF